jgi:transcriptional regulator with XRE-family HTH domain
MDATRQRIGLRIKSLRRGRGLTQEQVAERTRLSVNYLSRVERGLENPTLDTFLALAGALKVEPLDLFTIEQEEPDSRRLRQRLTRLIDEAQDDQLGQALKVLRGLLR